MIANTSVTILKKYTGMSLVEFFVKSINKDMDICLFGFGEDGKAIYAQLRKEGLQVCCICDNNWLRISDEVEIISPEMAVRDNPDALFVVSSRRYCYAMEQQLLDLGVTEDRITSFNLSVVSSYRSLLPENSVSEMVSSIHYDITGVYPNLQSPRTFNEKMMSTMILPPMEIKSKLTDKFKVRGWVSNTIGEKYLLPLIGDWETVESIDWHELPPKYAMKLNHGCAFNLISHSIGSINVGKAKRQLKDWMKCNYGYMDYEKHYIPIKPHIICEKYIENFDNDIFDYKFFCFHGEPKYIMFLSQRKKGLKMLFLDLDWTVLPFVYSYPKGDYIPPKPEKIEELIALTKALCKGFDQVRVDWYVLNDGTIKFGEMTFTSAAGHASWNPSEWDLKLGDMW